MRASLGSLLEFVLFDLCRVELRNSPGRRFHGFLRPLSKTVWCGIPRPIFTDLICLVCCVRCLLLGLPSLWAPHTLSGVTNMSAIQVRTQMVTPQTADWNSCSAHFCRPTPRLLKFLPAIITNGCFSSNSAVFAFEALHLSPVQVDLAAALRHDCI